MTRLNRRSFLKTAAAASTVFPLFTIAGTKASGRVLGANDVIRVGVAGINGRGGSHIGELAGMEGVEVTYLIDPDSSLFESRSANVASAGGNTPRCVQDIRQALDDDNLDVVTVATCNHWHSLIAIWACQAGKDVYVEKPISHNVAEGRRCVEAAAKYNRIVQHGTQQRSDAGRAREIAAVQSGHYGKLLVSKGYCCKPRWSIGHQAASAPPADLDFNIWLGPAAEQPFHRNLVHYNWHWFWDTGNGDVGNQGVHEMDVARWAIKGATLPRSVWSLGGRFAVDDQGQTPNTQMAVFDYDGTLLVFEVRGLVEERTNIPRKVANEYYLEAGMIADGKFFPQGGGAAEPLIDAGGTVSPGGAFGSFIAAVRSRDAAAVNCDAEEGHYSSALCHLANISYRLGQPAKFSAQTKAIGENKVVHETFAALEENLGPGVGLKLDELTYQLGRTLSFDPQTERFTDDDEANRMLTREYRPPFVVPEKV